MKKLLSIIGTIGITVTGTNNIVACGAGKTKIVKQPTSKATDQQFADEIAKIINKKKEINLSFEEFVNKNKIISKIKKDFIKENIEIKNIDTTEFDKTKIDIRLNWNTNEIRNTKILYNGVSSTINVNLKIRRI